jgi:hypothetical protein
MKKLLLGAGVIVGFLVGSRSGQAPYQRVQGWLRDVAKRPEVRKGMGSAKSLTNTAKDAVSDQVEEATHKVQSKVASVRS